jgi:hypothetical protein
MTIATAKPPGLIITSLISSHPTMTAIAFGYLIIMIGYPSAPIMTLHLCSHMSSNPSGLTKVFQ